MFNGNTGPDCKYENKLPANVVYLGIIGYLKCLLFTNKSLQPELTEPNIVNRSLDPSYFEINNTKT